MHWAIYAGQHINLTTTFLSLHKIQFKGQLFEPMFSLVWSINIDFSATKNCTQLCHCLTYKWPLHAFCVGLQYVLLHHHSKPPPSCCVWRHAHFFYSFFQKKGSWLTVEIGSKCKMPLVEIKEEPFLVLFTCCLLVAGLSTAPMTVGWQCCCMCTAMVGNSVHAAAGCMHRRGMDEAHRWKKNPRKS